MNPFKAYDIRGIYPHQVNEELAYAIGRTLPLLLKTDTIVVGRDGRLSSDSLFDSLLRGLLESGTNVINIGTCSTPQFYYALYSTDIGGGIMITASHNPKEYNGFKICEAKAKPIFAKNKLPLLESMIEQGQFKIGAESGQHIQKDINEEYQRYFSRLKKEVHEFSILVDTGNGVGIFEASILKKLFPQCNIDIIFPQIDGNFPNHECNPVIESEYTVLKEKLLDNMYDFGIAFDGDGDRVTFFTKEGLIPPDIITGIVGVSVSQPQEKVGFEVRTSQGVSSYLTKHDRIPCLYPSGHAFIKQEMAKDKAVFAGEKSGHYFYQNLYNTDSSLYTVMNMLHLLSSQKKSLKELVKEVKGPYSNSGEINTAVSDPDTILKKVQEEFSSYKIKTIDGISIYGDDFFFNIRKSNTENLVRMNIESTSQEKIDTIHHQLKHIIARQ